ncbi:TIGR02466 family protein [Falsiruegeria mediterranea]
MKDEDFSFVRRAYFPTMIFQIDLPNPEKLNETLLNNIHGERERDQKGISRSNIPALGGWHSHNNLHKSEDYAELVGVINNATDKLSENLGYAETHNLRIGTMWSIINPPRSANKAHVHPGCLWSGVYYIQAPEKCGNIEFVEPRTVHLMNQAKYQPNKKRPKECWTKVRFKPVPGRMIIFPSWLYHSVDTNMTEESGEAANRIIISFNLNQVKAK